MSKQIQKIIEETGTDISGKWMSVNNVEKLIEHIVCECVELAACNGHVSGFALGDLMKEHFGVNE